MKVNDNLMYHKEDEMCESLTIDVYKGITFSQAFTWCNTIYFGHLTDVFKESQNENL